MRTINYSRRRNCDAAGHKRERSSSPQGKTIQDFVSVKCHFWTRVMGKLFLTDLVHYAAKGSAMAADRSEKSSLGQPF